MSDAGRRFLKLAWIKGICAGALIAFGAVVNLKVGGLAGAVMFSFALYLICVMDFELFTGRIWGVIDGRYNVWQMVKMLINNFIGVFIVVVLVLSRNNLGDIIEGANQIVDIRTANGPTANVAYGILCGLLIYCAVEGYKKTKHPFAVMLPIAVFVICGFNHCIADFAYCWIC